MKFGKRPYLDLPAPSPKNTLEWMKRITLDSQNDMRIRGIAEELTINIFNQDYLSEYAAILNYVRKNIKYIRDPRTIEQIKTPLATIETGNGDCDDIAVLIASLISVIGGKVRFVAGAFKIDSSGNPMPSHVWCEAYDPLSNNWIVLDPVPGRYVNKMLKSTIYRLSEYVS